MTVGRLIFWRGDGDDDVKLVFDLLWNMVKYYGNNTDLCYSKCFDFGHPPPFYWKMSKPKQEKVPQYLWNQVTPPSPKRNQKSSSKCLESGNPHPC